MPESIYCVDCGKDTPSSVPVCRACLRVRNQLSEVDLAIMSQEDWDYEAWLEVLEERGEILYG